MIAGEEGARFVQREAEMIGCVAGRRDGGQRPAIARYRFAVDQHLVGRIVGVESSVSAWAIIGDRQRCAADDRRTGQSAERCGGGGMVAMGVGAEDGAYPRAVDDAHDRLDMAFAVGVGVARNAGPRRAGVDYRDIGPGADDPRLRAGVGVGGRVGGEHAPHQRFQLFPPACADAVGPVV